MRKMSPGIVSGEGSKGMGSVTKEDQGRVRWRSSIQRSRSLPEVCFFVVGAGITGPRGSSGLDCKGQGD